jgi:small-conductance mechanosensitive channel
MATSEWHWEQGAKFAIEGIKTSLLLNGAAAIALLTFANTRAVAGGVKWAIFLFALGAMVSVIAFLAAYKTQLAYGNAEVPGSADKNRIWKNGRAWNSAAIALVVISVLVFVIGSVMVLWSWPTTQPPQFSPTC